LALSQPWLFAPGSDFSYSNTNYVVVGMMLSRSNRKPLARLLSQRIFRPARMTSASFPRSAWSHRPRLAEYAILKSARSLRRSSPSLFSAAGAVVANTRDLDRFYRALITGRLLAPGLLRSMVTPRSTKTLKYGLGIYAVGDPCPGPNGQPQVLYGHDGATFGTQTLAFTSADGTRQASIAWTGRQYVAAPPTAKPANDFLVEAFSANCPRPVPAPSPGAGPTRQQRSAGQLPPLQELVPPDLEVHRPAP
jgi:D-alanyl-D-alanine carboxypeptidase